jgi:hypothetical protein
MLALLRRPNQVNRIHDFSHLRDFIAVTYIYINRYTKPLVVIPLIFKCIQHGTFYILFQQRKNLSGTMYLDKGNLFDGIIGVTLGHPRC